MTETPAKRKQDASARRVRRFPQAGELLGERLRGAGARRGFAETKLLTRWAEIVGPDLAAVIRPIKVSYAREGFGATLVVACAGPRAAEVSLQLALVRERVNACYGYNAISRVALTQEDARGFAEAQAAFARAEPAPTSDPDNAAARVRAAETARAVGDPDLRRALETLGTHILGRGPDR